MRYEFPDKIVDTFQLSKELEALGLPNLSVVERKSRRVVDGVVQKAPPYISVTVDELSGIELASIRALIAAHVPPPNPTEVAAQRQQARQQRLDRISEIDAIPRSNWTTAQMRELIVLLAQEVTA